MLNWNSHRIEDAVGVCLSDAKAVSETHAAIRGHVARIRSILAAWISKLIVERRPGQVSSGAASITLGLPKTV